MRGAFILIGGLAIALGAGLVGYQLGISANVATEAGTAAAVPVYGYWGYPHFFGGFLFFPLFFFLFLGLLFLAFGWRRRGPWGYGRGYGYGPMSEGDPRREWIVDAHRRLHEEDERRGSTDVTGGPGGGSTGGSAGPTGSATG
jgi:hypothetical protein